MRGSRTVRLAVAAAFAIVPLPARAAVPAAVLEHAWSEATTPHVRVLTDAGLPRALHVAERLERLHEQVERTVPALARASSRPCTVFLFADDATYQRCLPTYGGRPEEAAGLFQPGPTGDWVLLEDGRDAQLDPVALHEYTHALMRVVSATPPLWLNEGLAQYFSTLRVDAADARVGEPAPELVAWVRAHDLVPVDELVAVTYASPDYHGGERRATFYAESWLLVHMMLNEGTGDLAHWGAYLDALRDGEEPGAAFRAAFGGTRELQWRLELYAHRPSFSALEWSFSQPFASLTLSSRSDVPAVEVLAALGAMRLWQPGAGPESADEDLAAARSMAPGDPATEALASAIEARRDASSGATATGAPAAPTSSDPGPAGVVAAGEGVGTPPSREELRLVTRLLFDHPAAARRYLSGLLERPLSPGTRASATRLLRLLQD